MTFRKHLAATVAASVLAGLAIAGLVDHQDVQAQLTSAAAGIQALQGDCTGSGSGLVSVICLKTNGVLFGTAATQNTGVSGANVPLLNGLNTWSTEQILAASITGHAPLNIPQGTAPTSPVNGDVWTTSAGMFVQIAGSTVGPFGAGGSGCTVAGTVGQAVYNSGSSGCLSSAATFSSSGLLTALDLDFTGTTAACTAATNGFHITASNTESFCINGSSVGNVTSTGLNGIAIGSSSTSTGGFTVLIASSRIENGSGHTLENNAPPTVTSGGGTSPTVTGSSTFGFTITEGASGTPSSALVLAFTSTSVVNGWVCRGWDITNPALDGRQSSAPSTGAATLTWYTTLTGVATAPANSDVLGFHCDGF